MRIRTIIYDAVGFYISLQLWNDANYAFRNNRHNGWLWIGSHGWYATETNKRIFEQVAQQLDLTQWYDGEYCEVDITIV